MILHFAPHALHYVIVAILYICARSRRVKDGNLQAEQAQWVFRGPQVSSCEHANIVVIKASLGASNHYP
jgi:hypothetical protein